MVREPEDVESERLKLELRLSQLEARDAARGSFLSYVKYTWPEAILGAHHRKIAQAFDRIANGTLKRLIINMPPRHAIMTSMNIPTNKGFKALANLCVGDFVFGPDGIPVRVLGKSEVFRDREIYRVWTDDGAYLDVDGEHLWTVRLDRKYPKMQDYTTEQLWRRQNGESLRTTRNGRAVFIAGKHVPTANVRLPRLPEVAPVQYEEASLLVDPYVLGLWLGDGHNKHAIISSHDDDAAIIRPEIERRGYRTTDQATKMTFGLLGLVVQLRELCVHGNKHIPAQYMTASETQRRDLLKGLMDSDGNISKKGQCFFAQSNRDFCLQVQQLIQSLGIKANLIESQAMLNGRDYGRTWKVSFYASDIAFLSRKEERTLKTKRTFGRYIKIEKLGTRADTQCIKVDRDDGLFLAGDGYIVTHNTKSEFASYLLPSYLMGRDPRLQIIEATHTAELAVKFGRKVRDLMDTDKYEELFPEVKLKSDSKAAGRWDTNKGGSYFAVGVGGAVTGRGADLCVDPAGLVQTPQGKKRAGDVCVGDKLLGIGGYGNVRHVIWSEHEQTIVINEDMRVTALHPLWVVDRGWVDAKDVKVGDKLYNPHKTMYNSSMTQKGGISDEQLRRAGHFSVAGQGEDLFWVPVEVRSTRTENHGPRAFVNFHVEGSNTYVYNQYLTHNCIIDDPHSEQDAMSELALENAWEWYQGGPRTRLQPGGAIVIVMTRWGTRDLTARLLKAQTSHHADKWEVIEFPAIMPSGKPLWPEYWKLEELEAVRASLSVQKWNAMYQQQPTNDEGAILKREWWQRWDQDSPPAVDYIIQSYDTAYSKKETADFSVITTWGVFFPSMDEGANIILLGVKRGRWDFPELKRVALDEYKYWNPDNVLIEAKATGVSLQQEMRRLGIPVTTYTPGGRRTGTDKVSRANAVSPILESGLVWAPDTAWAEELVEECAAFPNGDNDDMVDSTTMALMRFRQGNFIALLSDEDDPEQIEDVVPEYY